MRFLVGISKRQIEKQGEKKIEREKKGLKQIAQVSTRQGRDARQRESEIQRERESERRKTDESVSGK